MSKPDILTGLTKEQVLAEIEGVIRTMPDPARFHHHDPEILAWLGRASAAIENWSAAHMIPWNAALANIQGGRASGNGETKMRTLLYQAQSDLRLKTIGPANVAIGQGGVFDYFDELRKIIEMAKTDILFVDPYMEAEFVSRYLPHVSVGTMIRLLTLNKVDALLPAAKMFAQQHSRSVDVRTSKQLHDRYVFIDKRQCYSSGASFKDGAKRTGTTITEHTDAFAALSDTYENLWSNGTVAT